jgi:hypothetical protein
MCKSINVIRKIKSRPMRWEATRREEQRNAYKILVGKPEAQ